MSRKIKLADLEAAVVEAYESFKSNKEGEAAPETDASAKGKFGISVALADGSLINKGDTDALFTLGGIAKIPVAATLLQQMSVEEIVKKSGMCRCCADKKKSAKPDVPFCLRGVRAVSAVQPTGDLEGKMGVISDTMIGMAGAEPVFSDRVYEAARKAAADAKAVDALAEAGFYLYDDAATSIDAYLRMTAMQYNTAQLATMGATIAADGYNAATSTNVFDGSIAQNIVGMMVAKGPHKMSKPWIIVTGLPAKSSRSGAMLAVLPGVMAIAAYAPELNEAGVSVKASAAIRQIALKLGLNALASARVEIEK